MRQDPSPSGAGSAGGEPGGRTGVAPRAAGRVGPVFAERYPLQINRQALTREVVLSANLDGLPLGEAMNQGQDRASAGCRGSQGTRSFFTRERRGTYRRSFRSTWRGAAPPVISSPDPRGAVRIVLEPFSIMLSLPLSIVGMRGCCCDGGHGEHHVPHRPHHADGLVTKNAILLVDYAKVLQSRGTDRTEAVITAADEAAAPS